MDKNLQSIKKFQDDIDMMSKIAFFLPKSKRDEINNIKKQMHHLTTQFELFNKNFSDYGWCAYDHININLMENANEAFKEGGIDSGEKVLIDYYTGEVKDSTRFLKHKSQPYMERADMIQNALDEHFAGKYYASIPLFLIIIDGSVNDFTKSKGFFAEGTDVTAWDCLVGCDDGLKKLRDIFNSRRNKTNSEEIRMPYRNGILHGRDLNFANAYVSCKCLSLMFALADWMQMKNSEEQRKAKFKEETNLPSIKESIKKLKRIKQDREDISAWKKRIVVINKDIPICPQLNDCSQYEYLKPLVKMFSAWKNKNYGNLSVLLKSMFSYVDSDSKRAGECRQFFASKEFVSYELVEVEERGCALTRVLTSVSWKSGEIINNGQLEFGISYQNNSKELALPWKNNGEWTIITWNINALYN